MAINMQAIVDTYQSDVSLTCTQVGELFGLKAADVAVVLRMHGVAPRRGNPVNLADSREKAIATRKMQKLRRVLRELQEEFGNDTVAKYLEEVKNEQPVAAE